MMMKNKISEDERCGYIMKNNARCLWRRHGNKFGNRLVCTQHKREKTRNDRKIWRYK